MTTNLDYSNATEFIEHRTMGALPLSIATSLAFEGVLGKHPQQIELNGGIALKPQLHGVKTIHVNVETLIRNILNATDNNLAMLCQVEVGDLISAVYWEIENISNLKDIDPVFKGVDFNFYIGLYPDLHKRLPLAIFKQVLSDKDRIRERLVEKILDSKLITVCEFNRYPLQPGRFMVLTHLLLNLVSIDNHGRGGDAILLESHTGKTKERHLWGSRLATNCKDHILPLNILTAVIYGDGVHFNSQGIKVKRFMCEMATKHHWNGNTTLGRMIQNIKAEKSELAQFILELYSSCPKNL